jgi:hypothetical protein
LVQKAGLRILSWETPVFKKPGQKPRGEAVYRLFMEKIRCASLLDFYCSPLGG